jgi:hypothetical protein
MVPPCNRRGGARSPAETNATMFASFRCPPAETAEDVWQEVRRDADAVC